MSWRPLKRFCDVLPQYGLNIAADQYVTDGLRFVRTTDVTRNGQLASPENGVFIDSLAANTTYRLQDGDLLFSRSGSLGRCLHYRSSHGPATFAGYLVRFRPRCQESSRYLAYFAQSTFFREAIAADSVSSTIANFNADRYASLYIPWWSRARQRAIADFLDVETASTDALIAKKRGMAVLVRERLVALRGLLVLEAVARFGEIPLRRCVECLDSQRVPLNREDRSGRSGPYPYWGAGSVVDHLDEYLFDEELVLLGEDGAPFFDDRRDIAFWVNERVWVNNHIHVLRPGAGWSGRFLSHCLNAVDYGRYITGSTRDKLTQAEMGDIRVPAVPIEEQRGLTATVDAAMNKALAIIDTLNRQVRLIREHRDALVTAAVTGELDVPGRAA
jgi:restriction endonuclease S subunit